MLENPTLAGFFAFYVSFVLEKSVFLYYDKRIKFSLIFF